MNTTSQSTTPLGRFVQDNIFYIGAVAEFVTMDYLTKFFAELYLANGKTIAVISNYFSLTVSHNSKIAFSLPISGKLVAFITPLLLAVIIYLVKKTCDTSNKITKIALVFVISGTLGNFIDRIWHGYVIDFLSPSFFPSFNLADAYLTIGVLILVAANKWIVKSSEFTD